jgi:hypothetical protein
MGAFPDPLAGWCFSEAKANPQVLGMAEKRRALQRTNMACRGLPVLHNTKSLARVAGFPVKIARSWQGSLVSLSHAACVGSTLGRFPPDPRPCRLNYTSTESVSP